MPSDSTPRPLPSIFRRDAPPASSGRARVVAPLSLSAVAVLPRLLPLMLLPPPTPPFDSSSLLPLLEERTPRKYRYFYSPRLPRRRWSRSARRTGATAAGMVGARRSSRCWPSRPSCVDLSPSDSAVCCRKKTHENGAFFLRCEVPVRTFITVASSIKWLVSCFWKRKEQKRTDFSAAVCRFDGSRASLQLLPLLLHTLWEKWGSGHATMRQFSTSRSAYSLCVPFSNRSLPLLYVPQ